MFLVFLFFFVLFVSVVCFVLCFVLCVFYFTVLGALGVFGCSGVCTAQCYLGGRVGVFVVFCVLFVVWFFGVCLVFVFFAVFGFGGFAGGPGGKVFYQRGTPQKGHPQRGTPQGAPLVEDLPSRGLHPPPTSLDHDLLLFMHDMVMQYSGHFERARLCAICVEDHLFVLEMHLGKISVLDQPYGPRAWSTCTGSAWWKNEKAAISNISNKSERRGSENAAISNKSNKSNIVGTTRAGRGPPPRKVEERKGCYFQHFQQIRKKGERKRCYFQQIQQIQHFWNHQGGAGATTPKGGGAKRRA